MDERAEYRRVLRERWKKDGRCVNCGNPKPLPGRRRCKKCLVTSRNATRSYRSRNPEAFKRNYHERKAAGLCVSCGVPGKPRERGLLCSDCRETERHRGVRVKQEVMDRYGGKCTCCGETEIAFLTLDHIDGGGTALRKSKVHGAGNSFYARLRSAPIDPRLQVLCWNCNLGRRATGVCPHKDRSFYKAAQSRIKWQRHGVVVQ